MTYVEPVLPAIICVLLFLGVRRRRSGKALLLTAILLGLWTSPATAWLTSGTLEWWYPPVRPSGEVDAIVVLGEALRSPPHPAQPDTIPNPGTYLRCRYAAWLYHSWRAVPIIVTGGPAESPADQRVANVMRHLLAAEGVPDSMIAVEDQSRSTYENAIFSKRILDARGLHRVAVVTEAYHMLRTEKVFRKAGLAIVPAPCAWRTLDISVDRRFLLPTASMIRINDDSLHEWVGLLWYRLAGRI